MIIYKDAISGDEMFSDAFDFKEVDGCVYEVDCKTITVKKGADVDTGANASAEEAPEDTEDGVETVNNVVYSFRLTPSSFDKKSYLAYLKGYMKAISDRLTKEGKSEEDINAFKNGAKVVAGRVSKNFKDYEFYVGESMELTGMVALLNYRDDGITPYMIFWKHGLKEEKV